MSQKSGIGGVFASTMQYFILFVAITLGLMFIVVIYQGLFGGQPWLLQLAKCQFPVFVGLPIAGLCSSFVVFAFDTLVKGDMEFKMIGGMEIKGPTAPILLWVVCFFVISICIKILWNYNLVISGCS